MPESHPKKWTQYRIGQMARLTDEEMGKIMPRHTLAAQHGALLGSNFDSKVSQQIGISTSAVQLKRSDLNIQSFASTK